MRCDKKTRTRFCADDIKNGWECDHCGLLNVACCEECDVCGSFRHEVDTYDADAALEGHDMMHEDYPDEIRVDGNGEQYLSTYLEVAG